MNLPFSTVDPHSPIPLYYQIYLDLRRMIYRGLLKPDQLLPPELEICQAYNVGRQTVRQAIARLVDEGLLERFAGKGTFVRAIPNPFQFFLDRSFTQQMREMGRVPRSRVIRCELSVVNSDVPLVLAEKIGSPCLYLERIRLGDDEPICHQTTLVIVERCAGIEKIDFSNQSLYDILTSRYHLVINQIDHVVRAIAADPLRAELLEVPIDTPLLYVGTTTFLDDGDVIEYSASYYRADRYEYRTTHPPQTKPKLE
ncbi:MAG: GntR family transcriptional regulator [Anaerolineales bacterium]